MRTLSSADIARLRRIAAVLDQAPVAAFEHDEERRRLVRSIAGHLVPRLELPDTPLLVAVCGDTGAGKSHLVNAIIGARVAPEGVLRPTTVAPLLVAAPGENPAIEQLQRRLQASAPRLIVERIDAPVVDGAAFVDLPASFTDQATRRILTLADLVLVVVTPARYADAATWELVDSLRSRSIPTWIVLNRTELGDDTVAKHLKERLMRFDEQARLVVVDEGDDEADELRTLLEDVDDSGLELGSSLRKRVSQVVSRTAALTFPLDDARESADRLVAIADAEYSAAAESVHDMVAGDGLGAGAAAAKWSDVAERLAGVVTRRVGLAAEQTAALWLSSPGGAAVLADGHGLWRHPPDTVVRARDRLVEWERELGGLVAGHTRRSPNAIKLAQVVAAVKARALGDESKPRWRVRRRLRSEIDVPANEARARLADVAASIVSDDKDRFLRRLGARPTAEAIAELRELVTQFEGDPDDEPGAAEDRDA